MSIARYYCSLATDKTTTEAIFSDIEAEYNLTLRMIRDITGKPLLDEPEVEVLKHSIELKEPYLDPLNYIQVQLLSKYRHLAAEEPDSPMLEAYHRVIVSSIEGIATGLGTSG
jgi:phosphoenolpyruvate carboxylase